MQTSTIIIVYIDEKPYNFQVDIDHKLGVTSYYVSAQNENNPEYVPDKLEFKVDGVVNQEERLLTARQVQIARLIWQEILDKLNP